MVWQCLIHCYCFEGFLIELLKRQNGKQKGFINRTVMLTALLIAETFKWHVMAVNKVLNNTYVWWPFFNIWKAFSTEWIFLENVKLIRFPWNSWRHESKLGITLFSVSRWWKHFSWDPHYGWQVSQRRSVQPRYQWSAAV